jgi:hypothetical protein
MKLKKQGKLALNRDTLQVLASADTRQAAAAGIYTAQASCFGTCYQPTCLKTCKA